MDLIDAYLAEGRLREHAAAVRARAQLADELSQTVAWHSLAGSVFRARARAVCAEFVALSCALDGLADVIHARATVLAHQR